MKNKVLFITLALFSLCLLAPKAVSADEEPTPGVARISLIHGDVSTQRGDSGDWVATTVNAPLVRGDKVSTGARSRTEVQLDYANILRIDQRAEVKIADLTRTRIQIQVASGLVNFSVLKGTEAEVEIDTPNMAVHPLGEGSYRIQVNSPGDAEVTVRKGEAEVSTPQGSTTVEKNQVIYVKGTDNPEYQVAKAAHKDEWDEWNGNRDSEIRDASSWRYTNRYYTGSQDLDRYGHWVNVPDYDWCWTPYVNAGWVPYRDGRWTWEPYYGWTWVGYEPWGWAPYHYGRWFSWGDSWWWWPGFSYYGYYPTWAPAYVSFLGFGFGGRHWSFGFGFGFGSIGWLPLGPFDTFSPWWGFHNIYNVVNITNITNVTNIRNIQGGNTINTRTFVRNPGRVYTSNIQAALNNVHVRRAITTVPTNDFVSGRMPRTFQGVDAATLKQADVVRGTLPVVPTRDSLRPVDRPVAPNALPRQVASNERFFTKRATPAGPAPFSERAAEIQRMVQQHNPMANVNAGTPAGRANVGGNALRSGATSTPAMNPARPGNAAGQQLGRMEPGNVNRQMSGAPQQNPVQRTDVQAARPAAHEPAARSGALPANSATRSAAPQTGRALPAGVVPTERPGWQRFGTGRPLPGAVNRTPAEAVEAQNRPAPQAKPATTPQPAAPAGAREASSPGWRRFGTAARPEGTVRNAPAPSASRPDAQRFGSSAANVPSQQQERNAARTQAVQPRPVPSSGNENQGGWQRFSSQPRPAPGTGRFSPSEAAPRQGFTPRAVEPRPAPSSPVGGQAGWRQFTPQERPAASERAPGSSGPRAEPASPGWNRFPSRPEGQGPARGGGWNGPAPRERMNVPSGSEGRRFEGGSRGYGRPPLELRTPIVRERPSAPQSYGGGRSYSPPSGGNRGWSAPSGGGGRSYSAPAGGGHSAPAPSAPRGQGNPRGKN